MLRTQRFLFFFSILYSITFKDKLLWALRYCYLHLFAAFNFLPKVCTLTDFNGEKQSTASHHTEQVSDVVFHRPFSMLLSHGPHLRVPSYILEGKLY